MGALDQPVEIVLQSGLVANVRKPHLPDDPGGKDLLAHALQAVEHGAVGSRLTLSPDRPGQSCSWGDGRARVEGSVGVSDLDSSGEADPDQARFSVRPGWSPASR